MKKVLPIIFLLVFVSGCTQQSSVSETVESSESVLNNFQGIAVLDFKTFKTQLLPGESTYLQMRIRNNALGQIARNLRIRLDGIGLYHLLDCVSNPIPAEELNYYNSPVGGSDVYFINLVDEDFVGGSCVTDTD